MGFYDHFYSERKKTTRIGEWFVKIRNVFLLKLIFDYTKMTDINILEIGPGKGYFAKLCSTYKNIVYSAIEANENQCRKLQKRGLSVENDFVPPIKKLSKTFDVVVLIDLLEHMNNVDRAISLISEVSRVLKKNGLIIIISPDYLLFKSIFFDGDYTHNFVTTVRRVRQLIEDNGFETLYINYLSGPCRGNILTFLISQSIKFLYWTGIPNLFSWNRNAEERIFKIKSSLLRKFVIIGKKNI